MKVIWRKLFTFHFSRNTSHQRGSVLIYALLTMTVMLAIGVTLTGVFLAKLRSAVAARNSTMAVYAADSAAEKCLYEARQQKDSTGLLQFTNGATYAIASSSATDPQGTDVTLTGCRPLGTGKFQFRVTGIFQGVRRTLEITQ